MGFIAKTHLPYKGGFIKPGAKVPEDYDRFHEGIKRGWIEAIGDPAAITPPFVDEPITSSPPIASDPIPDQPIATSDIVAPEELSAYVEPTIEDLEYLTPMAKESLIEKGVVNVRDLGGFSAVSLDNLRGIGMKLAMRLIDELAKWKESFSEYHGINPDVDFGNMTQAFCDGPVEACHECGKPTQGIYMRTKVDGEWVPCPFCDKCFAKIGADHAETETGESNEDEGSEND